ncbi:MAG: hypothetical protein WC907_03205 [Acholeplasmataceae bacterium]|jgi:hypothetical protein
MIVETIITYSSWVALTLGIIGAIIIAHPTARAKVVGFEVWIYSNIFWIVFAYSIKSIPTAINFIFFTIISVVGIWNHIGLADKEKREKEELLKVPEKI